MDTFHRILQTAIDGGASDVHVKVGSPIVFRINRQLLAIQAPTPTNEWINSVVDLPQPVGPDTNTMPRGDSAICFRISSNPSSSKLGILIFT